MKKSTLIVPILFLSALLFSCTKPEEKLTVSPSFYHWKTIFDPQKTEKYYLEKLKIHKIYLHFFDVDIDPVTQKPLPKAELILKTLPTQEIIPTIFITNKTLENSGFREMEPLAENILRKVNLIAGKNTLSYNEIQLDCDWSKSTRRKYFRLLSLLKKDLPENKKLSVTIRLHQVKFPDITGVPPADRGTLMVYNTGDWRKAETRNSLFDLKTISQYLEGLEEYPLPLDIALPVFEQTLVYRNSVFLHFLKDTGPENLNAAGFLKKTVNPAIFVCSKDTFYAGVAFRKGDVFRHEKPSFDDLLEIKKVITTKLRNKDLSIIIYHLNERSIKNYPVSELEKLFL